MFQHKQFQVKWMFGILLALFLSVLLTPLALAADLAEGAQVFETHCAGCHINGGNIVRRGKTLKQPALKKNGYDSVEAIADITIHGKGNMSAYQGRLSANQIEAVATYVFEQAQHNWH